MGGGEGGASGDPTLTLSAEATGDSCPQPSRPNKVPGATRTTGHRTGLSVARLTCGMLTSRLVLGTLATRMRPC